MIKNLRDNKYDLQTCLVRLLMIIIVNVVIVMSRFSRKFCNLSSLLEKEYFFHSINTSLYAVSPRCWFHWLFSIMLKWFKVFVPSKFFPWFLQDFSFQRRKYKEVCRFHLKLFYVPINTFRLCDTTHYKECLFASLNTNRKEMAFREGNKYTTLFDISRWHSVLI